MFIDTQIQLCIMQYTETVLSLRCSKQFLRNYVDIWNWHYNKHIPTLKKQTPPFISPPSRNATHAQIFAIAEAKNNNEHEQLLLLQLLLLLLLL